MPGRRSVSVVIRKFFLFSFARNRLAFGRRRLEVLPRWRRRVVQIDCYACHGRAEVFSLFTPERRARLPDFYSFDWRLMKRHRHSFLVLPLP